MKLYSVIIYSFCKKDRGKHLLRQEQRIRLITIYKHYDNQLFRLEIAMWHLAISSPAGIQTNPVEPAAPKYNISHSAICQCCSNTSKLKHTQSPEWKYTINKWHFLSYPGILSEKRKSLQYIDITDFQSLNLSVSVIHLGFEPRAPTLKVLCSTGWASESSHNISQLRVQR